MVAIIDTLAAILIVDPSKHLYPYCFPPPPVIKTIGFVVSTHTLIIDEFNLQHYAFESILPL